METTEYTDIVLNGDLNWDPRRNTGFFKAVKSFMSVTGLVPLWEAHPVDFTHIHTDMSATSILDHFLVTERLAPWWMSARPCTWETTCPGTASS